MSKLTYADKVAVNANASIPDNNKCNASDMNNIKDAINQIGAYNTAVAVTNGDFKVTLKGTLTTDDIVKISFPSATDPDSNARLSIDGGTTYITLYANIKASTVQNKRIELIYDGTNFIPKVYLGAATIITIPFALPTNAAYTSVEWSTTKYDDCGFWSSEANTRFTIPDGIKKVRIKTNILFDSNATGRRAVRILKNGSSVSKVFMNATNGAQSGMNCFSSVENVVAGDYFEIQVAHGAGVSINISTGNEVFAEIEVVE